MYTFIFRIWTSNLNGQTIFTRILMWRLVAWLSTPWLKVTWRYVILVSVSSVPLTKFLLNISLQPGLAVNLSNSLPTTCINDMITAYNKKNSKNLPLLTFEKTLALIFNQIESILDRVQSGDVQYLYDLYYKHWLHRWEGLRVINLWPPIIYTSFQWSFNQCSNCKRTREKRHYSRHWRLRIP